MMVKIPFRKISTVLFLSAVTVLSAQKKKKASYEDILNTKSIPKIERFLKTAHPQDPRRTVLKPKLIALKNEAWTEGAKDAKPMAARPVVEEVPRAFTKRPYSSEAVEFQRLMLQNSAAMKEKTVKLLNQLFDNDVSNKEAILMVQNNSDCNMIMRISGDRYYNLAVPARGENSIVLQKGKYILFSNLCDEQYVAEKEVRKHVMVVLNDPVVKELNSGSSSTTANAQK